VHGYDMNCIGLLPQKGGLAPKIISGGDEKVLRVFDPPFSFVKTFNTLNADKGVFKHHPTLSNEEVEARMKGVSEASKQPLGLMNKPLQMSSRVDEEEGGIGPDFDPNKFLSNTQER